MQKECEEQRPNSKEQKIRYFYKFPMCRLLTSHVNHVGKETKKMAD
jgi:hypothetical protein